MLAIALVLPSCGGGESLADFKKGGPPPPPKCIERWNADQSALELGKHFYSPGHDSRAGHVDRLEAPNSGQRNQCLAVFAARESDREYGTIGMFTNPAGWVPITDLPVESEQERLEVQRLGSLKANVQLREDGSIAPF
jgi:hypothetical protein